MKIVQICVGSSCHLRGSEKIVELFQNAVKENGLDFDVVLTGSFCTERCNRVGVSVTIDDEVFTGITPENFNAFFEEKVLKHVLAERE